MADLSDVGDALVAMISALLYPNGTAAPSIAGANVRVYVGWPVPQQLDADLASLPTISHVSVYCAKTERNTTRYMDEWEQTSDNQPSLTLTMTGRSVTVAGQVPPADNPHHVMVMVNGLPYPYLVQPTDTLASIAAALAQLVAVDVPGSSSSGAIVTLPATANLTAARVGITQTVANEVRRQERVFQITVWANSPDMRKAIAKPVDLLLAKTRRFTLPDLSIARLIYRSSLDSDQAQKQQIYRRDLFYTVEYGTFETEIVSQITQFQTNLDVAVAGGAPQPIKTVFS